MTTEPRTEAGHVVVMQLVANGVVTREAAETWVAAIEAEAALPVPALDALREALTGTMKYKVQTLSGAQYLIDTEAMTWQRMRPKSGKGIIGTDKDGGNLIYPLPDVKIGQRAILNIALEDQNTYIRTTQVQRIELL